MTTMQLSNALGDEQAQPTASTSLQLVRIELHTLTEQLSLLLFAQTDARVLHQNQQRAATYWR